MTVIETLKRWVDVELEYTNKDIALTKEKYKYIIMYYFFGSCDLCSQVMEFDDSAFKDLYTEILRYIGISNTDINDILEVWMLNRFSENELFIINHGARCFREFENNPNGVGGLRLCFTKFSDKIIEI